MVAEYGLVGKGISHSFSGKFFNEKFLREKIDASYNLFDLSDISLFPSLLEDHPLLKGLNVTSPYKREIIPFLDILSPEAKELNAVNVIQFEKIPGGSRRLIGHNTDARGFLQTLGPLECFYKLKKPKALILGTGGAATAVAYALKKSGGSFRFVSRNPVGESMISYESLNSLIPTSDIIINATPLGMYPDENKCPEFDYSKLCPRHLCYDLIYNPEETLFMKYAKERGAMVKNGLEMLINQAMLSWEIWSEDK